MKIEFWIDVTSPFCYIAFRNMQNVRAKMNKPAIQISYRCYELDPTIPKKSNRVTLAEYYAHALDISVKEAGRELQEIEKLGKKEKLQFDFNQTKVCNSSKSLQLIKQAEKENKTERLLEVLFHSYFTLGKDISDVDTLLFLAGKAGLNIEVSKSILQQNSLKKQVEEDHLLGEQYGLEAIPFLVINQEIAFTGIQSEDIILEAISSINGSK